MTDERSPAPAPARSATSGPPPAAIGSLLLAVGVGVGAWYWFGRAADAGVRRLERLDAMRAYCERFYAQARDRNDTMRVDRAAVPDTVDAGSKDAFDRCGDFRGPSVPNALPNPREMNGQEMPRGLR
ncbi:hypothetical protein [Gemmatimonas sp.]|uniref:hypothetical protein n=1 Tax=Gemmatimonas sp. TaxID=1962908 RepID=UPI0025B7B607|nr:hypothetical protein [Gemmatimonas sp.]MCA2983182.1 hypothetical protein [Gemmatimonas sp.]MCA2995519.1 hypothetical protein [Gemmatimonas sp.]